ncbi:Tat pathway signal sequence domain protein [Allokutzneria sp. A3M-2-11 16]|uniref:glycosyl hydrolase family 95 catalytic domain-containing protein n=1 Tax=Allokutzneria sp. A3M-2-11 16 TaxID=2962043 RepID=UPI0020B8FA1B|nr:Tat pathway signal sequence domain protein [Allokutzneria sp. A3M-2-11 16]MCP3801706.1 Tat pathway signal sequence domain protein [Allokutzneria sp. A3M-2-11 16]
MGNQRWDVSRRGVLAGSAGVIAASALSGVAGTAAAAEARGPDWARFLREQDLVWRKLPTKWWQGPFLGDGRLGSMIYQEPGRNAIRFTTQHSEVQDYRPRFNSGWGVCRLPVGHLTLEPVGTITGVDWRLDLHNAELVGTVRTDKGSLALRAYIHTERSVLVAVVTPSGGERVRWVFHPEKAISPKHTKEDPPAGYVENPPPTTKTTGGTNLVLQGLVAGGQTATAYRVAGQTLYLSVAHTHPGTGAEAKALSAVNRASALPEHQLFATHRAWWNAYYRKSFVSIPDQRLQSFHWAQLYKIASGTRADAPVMATCGPWLEDTGWPATWWNLNVQLEYWLINGSNHLELDAITTTLDVNRQHLIDNVRAEYRKDSAGVGRSTDRRTVKGSAVARPGDGGGSPETGNLTWALHNVWLSYRHSMDDRVLRDTLFPLLRRAINYYLHFLKPGADGRLHLAETHSPEYGNAPDCNYDLALVRWGCETLLDADKRLGTRDPLTSKWRQVLRDLTPYPVDDTGFMIGAGVPYAKSHRHYSHLLMVYPLHLVTPETAENRALIERSIKHWHSLTGAHRGYSYTGAASMLALLGDGDRALDYLLKFFDTSTRFPVTENTMYREGSPVVETPLSASQSILDMLCQSWGGVIRVFPAIPEAWQDVAVENFLTQGAFLVSAVRKQGHTHWVGVRSQAGQRCHVRHGIGGEIAVSTPAGAPMSWRQVSPGVVEIDLARGATAIVHPKGPLPDLRIEPVRVSVPGKPWGLPD